MPTRTAKRPAKAGREIATMARWKLEGPIALAVHWSDDRLGRFYRLQLDVGELGLCRHQCADARNRRPGSVGLSHQPAARGGLINLKESGMPSVLIILFLHVI